MDTTAAVRRAQNSLLDGTWQPTARQRHFGSLLDLVLHFGVEADLARLEMPDGETWYTQRAHYLRHQADAVALLVDTTDPDLLDSPMGGPARHIHERLSGIRDLLERPLAHWNTAGPRHGDVRAVHDWETEFYPDDLRQTIQDAEHLVIMTMSVVRAAITGDLD